jgi:thiol-disulfide isomerase/thioredoxin
VLPRPDVQRRVQHTGLAPTAATAAATAAALAFLAAPTAAHAGRATCSNPGLPVGAAASGDLLPGRLTLGLTTGFLPLSSTETLDEPTGALLYESGFILSETRLNASLALTPWLAVETSFPYRVIDIDVTYRDPATGMVVMPNDGAIHSRTETLQGLGDPSLGVHLADERAGYRLHLRAGASLPLGRTESDPFILGMIGQEHQHIQLGTGTFIPSLAVEAQRPLGAAVLSLWALTYQSLYENGDRYQAGDRYSAGMNASASLGTRAWTFSGALEVHTETAETWAGVTHEDEGNNGRTDVLAGLAAAWRPLPSLAVVADVKVPLYSRVTGPQLDYDVVLALSVVGSYDLRQRASWEGLDHATLGAPGTDAPLTPVPGRVTVVDLWARWCAPCRELDERLNALARRFPDRLAVRTLDVVDTDSAAWLRYLEPGSFVLPHIKVYGADGALLFEKTAPPDELVRAVEDALTR